MQRRSGTYAVIGADYGVDPYGDQAAPVAVSPFSVTFSVVPTGTPDHGNVDGARAALWKAVGGGKTRRLVKITDTGEEQVNTAKAMGIADITTPTSPYMKDFTVTWELLGRWRDRYARNVRLYGVGSHLYGETGVFYGATAIPFTGIANGYGLFADGSDGLPVPWDDDNHPTLDIQGPFGGDVVTDPVTGEFVDGGFELSNQTVPGGRVHDFAGASVPIKLTVRQKLGPLDRCHIDCASRRITINGAPAYDKLIIPPHQTDWMRVVAGSANVLYMLATGANPTYRQSAVQPLTLVGNPSGGTWTATVTTPNGVSATTVIMSYAINAALVQSQLEALANVGVGNVGTSGGPFPAPIYVGFAGTLGFKAIPTMVINNSLTGGTTPKVVTPVANTWMIAITGAPTSGTWHVQITAGGVSATTAALAYNATFADVYNAILAAISTMPGITLSLGVFGGPGPNTPWTINFSGAPHSPVVTLLASSISLAGGSGPAIYALPSTAGGTGSLDTTWFGYY